MRSYLLGRKLRRTQLVDASRRCLPAVCEAMEPRRLLAHHLITFDDVPAGTVVTEQYPGVSFSSFGDANLVVRKADVGTSGGSQPNEIGGEVHLTDTLRLDFDQPIVKLKFVVTGISDTGIIAQISVSYDGTSSATTIVGGAASKTIDLSGFRGVTRIQISNITDANGIGFDDFQFDDASRIRGKVVDVDGHPLHGAQVSADVPGGTISVFTDHPSSINTPESAFIDANLDGDFEIYGVSASATVTLHFSVAFGVGPVLEEQVSGQTKNVLPSQFVNGVADVGTITLQATEVIRNGKIRLLRDMANFNQGDLITRRLETGSSASARVAASARYKAEITAVTQKLASLGFRQTNGTGNGEDAPPLTVTDTWAASTAPLINPPQPERALLLFQAIWSHGSSTGFAFDDAVVNGHRSIINGEVDPATLAALNAASGVIWAKNDAAAKAKFPNIFTYQTPTTPDRWINASAVRFLSDLSAVLTPVGITALHINSVSPATGSREPGAGHAAGSEVDMTWVTHAGTFGQGNFYRPIDGLTEANVAKGPNKEPLETVNGQRKEWTIEDFNNKINTPAKAIAVGRTWIVQDSYDRAKTSTLIKKILAFPSSRVYQVIFNDPQLHNSADPLFVGADSRFIFVAGHNNHVHVGTKFNQDILNAGTSGAPAWPPVAFTNRSITTPINEGGTAILRGTIVDSHANDVFLLEVNWGDGTGTRSYRFGTSAARRAALSHVYRDDGNYSVFVRWHSQQANGNSAVLSLRVKNVAPAVHAGDDSTLKPSGWLKRSGFFTDPGADIWSATVDYGDGSGPQKLEFAHDGSFLLRHKYHRRGRFVVVVRVIDDDGGVGTTQFTVAARQHAHHHRD